MAETNEGTPPNSVLSPFTDFLNEYKNLLVAMAGIGTTAAVSSLAMALGPPWPNRLGVATLTGVASMVLLAWTFLTWRRQGRRELRPRRMQFSAGFTALLGLVYLVLWASLVIETKRRLPCRRLQAPARSPGGDEEGRDHTRAGAHPRRNSTPTASGPTAGWPSQVALLASWVGFFCGISAVLTTLLLASRPRRPTGGPWPGARARSLDRSRAGRGTRASGPAVPGPGASGATVEGS